MHILHGTWLPPLRKFVFWGEDTEPARRKPAPGSHPFGLSLDACLRHLDLFVPDAQPDGLNTTLYLPSVNGRPMPSPEAVAVGLPMEDPRFATLKSYSMNMMTLAPKEALGLLLNLNNNANATLPFRAGADLLFWNQAARYLFDLVAEGRYRPQVTRKKKKLSANWLFLPDPALHANFAKAMPSLCRAVTEAPERLVNPVDLLNDFLDAMLGEVFKQLKYKSAVQGSMWWALTNGIAHEIPSVDALNPRDRRLLTAWEKSLNAYDGDPDGDDLPDVRVCFRLSEPEESDPAQIWRLDFLLQSADDPNAVADARAIYNPPRGGLKFGPHTVERPAALLLSSLARAVQIFPPIGRSLSERTPAGVLLMPDEVFGFLANAVPALQEAGYAVLVPSWWTRPARLKARRRLKHTEMTETAGILGRRNLVNYKWELAIGDAAISAKEFEQLVATKQSMVRIKGQWVAMDIAQMEAALDYIGKRASGSTDLLGVLQMEAGAEDVPEGVELEDPAVDEWLQDVINRLNDPTKTATPELPTGLRASLRPYQERGFAWLAQMRQLGLGACLADDMGLGKTLQTITFWLHEREKLGVGRPALLVCPSSVVANWRHEIARFAPSLRVMIHQGANRQSGELFAAAAMRADVVLTSYPLLARDVDTLKTVTWSSAVLDEAQNIKNPTTKQAAAARAINADYRLALTGTPIENRLLELWSIMQYLNPGYLSTKDKFKEKFSNLIEKGDRGSDAVKQAADTLRKLIAPFILRRVKTDPNVISDLPEKFENKAYCALTPEQATLYEAVVREEMAIIEGTDESAIKRRANVLRMLTRLKQICNHPVHFLKEEKRAAEAAGTAQNLDDRSGKLTRLQEMLEELLQVEDKALIFTQYAELGSLIVPYLEHRLKQRVLYLHGGTPIDKRAQMVEEFNTTPDAPIFVLSLKAGGTGLNLTGANHVFHYDRWYNPAVEDQATDRAFRIGQRKNVQVHKFICSGTLEEKIDELIESKRDLASRIVGTGEDWLSEMSNDDLRDLVTLRREAVQLQEPTEKETAPVRTRGRLKVVRVGVGDENE